MTIISIRLHFLCVVSFFTGLFIILLNIRFSKVTPLLALAKNAEFHPFFSLTYSFFSPFFLCENISYFFPPLLILFTSYSAYPRPFLQVTTRSYFHLLFCKSGIIYFVRLDTTWVSWFFALLVAVFFTVSCSILWYR